MQQQKSTTEAIWIIAGALLSWGAVLFQLVLMLQNRVTAVPEALIRFFSFYTILTNILVAVCFTAQWRMLAGNKVSFFTKPATLTATAVYILVVGLVYNVVLRGIWAPQGWQRLVDEALHVAVPVVFILYWFLFVPKLRLPWRCVLWWLLYPAAYLLFVLMRGAASDFYPYPFVDVAALGYARAAINCAFLFAGFLLLSVMFTAIARRLARRQA